MMPHDHDELDFTPGTAIIHAMRNASLTWLDVLKELIDNAIDAGATRITLCYTPGRRGVFVIEDNGQGCADLKLLLGLGYRADSAHTRIGRYGVGAKDALVWAANGVGIQSVCTGKRHDLSHNWDAILREGRWRFLHAIKVTETTEPSGLRLELRELRHRHPDRPRLEDELGRTYMPWLRQGHQLLLTMPKEEAFLPIEPFAFPPLLEQQTETILVEGKTATLTLGLIPPHLTIPWRGVLCIYGSRLITHAKRLGIAPEALCQLSGWAEFSRGWSVEKNKRDFTEDLSLLEEEVATRFAALIARATQQQLTQPQEALKTLLNERLKQFNLRKGPWRKARRPGPRGIKRGTVPPTGTGTPHGDAAEDQPGKGWQKRRFLSMGWAHLGVTGPRCQKIDDVISINLDNPAIAQALLDPPVLEQRLASTLAVYLAVEWEDPQMLLPFAPMYGAADRIFTFEGILRGMRLAEPPASDAAAD